MARTPILSFLDGYERPDDGRSSATGKRFFLRSFSGSLKSGKGSGGIIKLIGSGERITHAVSYTTAKAYGAAMLAFGLVTLTLHFVNDYFEAFVDAPLLPLIVGALCSLLAVPLLLFDRPVSSILQDNPITDYIFFEFFCIKRMHNMTGNVGGLPTSVMATLGALVGFVGYFVPIEYILISIGTVLFLYLSFVSPEFSFFASVIALPYLSYIPYSDAVFAAMVVTATVSLLRKIVCAKRVYFFEQYDLLLGVMIFAILISGIFNKGIESLSGSLYMLVMALGYILASNLITNRRLADCAMNALVISSLPAAGIAIYCFITEAISRGAMTMLEEGVSSTFPTASDYAVFLIISTLVSVILAKQSTGALRALYVISTVLNLTSLVFTAEPLALAGVAVASVVYPALRTRRLGAPVTLLLVALPYMLLALPAQTVDAVLAYIPGTDSFAETVRVWRVTFNVFKNNIYLGIGIGSESFVSEMESYHIYGHTSAYNVFLELGVEAGIFALVAFVLSLLVRLRHRARYARYVASSEVSILSPMIGATLVGLVFYGSMNYVWGSSTSFYLFWLIFGVASASLRIAKQESDDRILYYEDTRASDYSAIDVEIR